jgi:CubicO group peptidase (beta-lactamase class C family)
MLRKHITFFNVILFFISTCLVQACFAEARKLEEVEAGKVGFSAERLQRLDQAMNDYVRRNELPGGVILVARHGKIAHLTSFGWRDKETLRQS